MRKYFSIILLAMIVGCSAKTKKLVSASSHGNLQAVRELLNDGANPNTELKKNRWTPLHIAAAGGHADIVEVLLEAGVPIDSKAKVAGMEGAEATFFAAMYGYTNVIDCLAERGANLKQTFLGMTLSEYAIHFDHPNTALFIEELILKKDSQPVN